MSNYLNHAAVIVALVSFLPTAPLEQLHLFTAFYALTLPAVGKDAAR